VGIPLEIEQKLIVFEEFPEETTVTKGVGDGDGEYVGLGVNVGVGAGVLVGDGKGVADNDGVGDGVKEGLGLIIISLSDSIEGWE